jgi:two-component system, cell cycle response regulator CtrA
MRYRPQDKSSPRSVIRTGELVVDLAAGIVEVDSRKLPLTGKEYGVLELLSMHKGATLTKAMFLDHLYGGVDAPEVKIIDVFVCNLRKKLTQANAGKHYIETVWGRGYTLRDPREPEGDRPSSLEGGGVNAAKSSASDATAEAASPRSAGGR